MVRRIVEGVQLIHIGPNTRLTEVAIQYALMRANASKMYAKFYTDKYFIQVNFMRDNTINVATNIKDPSCIRDLWQKERQGWTMALAKVFVYRWMQLSRSAISR